MKTHTNSEALSFAVLARSAKLREIGQMAAGVSHDLKNILGPLSLHLQVVDRAVVLGDVEDARESIAEMKQIVARGVETIDRLLAYSRQTEAKSERVDLDCLALRASLS